MFLGLGYLSNIYDTIISGKGVKSAKKKKKKKNLKRKKEYIFFDEDASLEPLDGLVVSIIGYGNQGRAQALNLRDSGVKVIVGNIRDSSYKRAEEDGFDTYVTGEAVKRSDIILFLIPDEIMPKVYEAEIAPNLKPGSTLVFASGYNIAFGKIKPAENINVLMLAPRMIGLGVRERFLSGEGFISYVCVHHDFSKKSKELLLALSKAVGALKHCSIEITMKQEAQLDLFMEQGFVPSLVNLMMTSFDTLIKNGIPPEAVLTETYLSEEMSYIFKSMAKIGFVDQMYHHSHTSQYGTWTRGPRYISAGEELSRQYDEVFEEIDSGKFAKEWSGERAKQRFMIMKHFSQQQKISKLEKEVKKNMRMKETPVQVPEGIEELLKKEELQEDIKKIRELFEFDEDTE